MPAWCSVTCRPFPPGPIGKFIVTQMAAVAEDGWQAIAYDRRGYGETDSEDVPFSIVVEAYALGPPGIAPSPEQVIENQGLIAPKYDGNARLALIGTWCGHVRLLVQRGGSSSVVACLPLSSRERGAARRRRGGVRPYRNSPRNRSAFPPVRAMRWSAVRKAQWRRMRSSHWR